MPDRLILNRYDPTQTTTLRNDFAREMRKRFYKLRGIIRKAIVDEDCFGLTEANNELTTLAEMTTPGRRAFVFATSADKVDAFMEWLEEQVERGILEVSYMPQLGEPVRKAWTDTYINSAYRKGVHAARQKLIQFGYDVPGIEETGGIDVVMQSPFHADRVGLLYTRTYNDLKNITNSMSGQISRVLAQGMAEGRNPRQIAQLLTRTISGPVGDLGLTDTLGRFIPAQRRAEMLARTEVIRAHHVATVQEYRNWKAEGVIVQAEWSTAGDSRVCEDCAQLEGKEYTLDEIESMIPRHPQCRCIALPVDKTKAKGAAEEIEGSIPGSILPEDIRKEFAEAVKRDGLERSILLDSKGNRLTEVIVGDVTEVGGFHPLMDKPGAKLISIHVHPRKASFSLEDVRTLARYPGLDRMVVVMPDETAQMMVRKGTRRAILDRAEGLYEAKRTELIDAVVEGRMTRDTANKLLDSYRDDILRVLEKDALITIWDETGMVRRKR